MTEDLSPPGTREKAQKRAASIASPYGIDPDVTDPAPAKSAVVVDRAHGHGTSPQPDLSSHDLSLENAAGQIGHARAPRPHRVEDPHHVSEFADFCEAIGRQVIKVVTPEEIIAGIARYLKHLEVNADSLLETGYPETRFPEWPWLDRNISPLLPVKVPIDITQALDASGRPTLRYTWGNRLPGRRKADCETYDRLFGGWGSFRKTDSGYITSDGEPLEVCSYDQAPVVDFVGQDEMRTLVTMREPFLRAKREVLQILTDALRRRMPSSILQSTVDCIVEHLERDEVQLLVLMHWRYGGLDPVTLKKMPDAYEKTTLNLGGLVDILRVVGQTADEMRSGTMYRMRRLIGHLLTRSEQGPEGIRFPSYCEVLARGELRALEKAWRIWTTDGRPPKGEERGFFSLVKDDLDQRYGIKLVANFAEARGCGTTREARVRAAPRGADTHHEEPVAQASLTISAAPGRTAPASPRAGDEAYVDGAVVTERTDAKSAGRSRQEHPRPGLGHGRGISKREGGRMAAVTLFHLGGAEDFEILWRTDPDPEWRLSKAEAVNLLRARGHAEAAALFEVSSFTPHEATNHFEDEFTVLFYEVSTERFVEWEKVAESRTDWAKYAAIAQAVLDVTGLPVRFVAVGLRSHKTAVKRGVEVRRGGSDPRASGPYGTEELIADLERMRDIMTAVATGGARIDDANEEYRRLYGRVDGELGRRRIANPNSCSDLWDWYRTWKAADMVTYAARRAFLADTFSPLIGRLRRPEPLEEAGESASAQGSSVASREAGVKGLVSAESGRVELPASVGLQQDPSTAVAAPESTGDHRTAGTRFKGPKQIEILGEGDGGKYVIKVGNSRKKLSGNQFVLLLRLLLARLGDGNGWMYLTDFGAKVVAGGAEAQAISRLRDRLGKQAVETGGKKVRLAIRPTSLIYDREKLMKCVDEDIAKLAAQLP